MKISADSRVRELCELVSGGLFNSEEEFVDRVLQQRFSLFRLQIRDHWVHALRYLLRMIFCPSKKEWLLFYLPGSLTFIYYIFRPFQVAWSAGQGFVQGKWRRI